MISVLAINFLFSNPMVKDFMKNMILNQVALNIRKKSLTIMIMRKNVI